MSFIYTDSLGPALAKLRNYNKLFSRFDGSSNKKNYGNDSRFPPGAWKTHFKYDLATNKYIEVYDSKLKYFRDHFIHDESIKRFVKALGMNWDEFTDDTGQDLNPVDDMWFYFKGGFQWDGTTRFDGGTYNDGDWADTPSFQPTHGLVEPTTRQIADELNKTFDKDDEIELTIAYGGGLKRYISTHELPWVATGVEVISGGFNSVEVREKLLSDPWYYLANSRHRSYVHDIYQAQLYNGGRNDELATGILRPSNRRLPVGDVSYTIANKKDESSPESDLNYMLSLLALMDDGQSFEPIENKIDGGFVFDPKVATVNTNYMDRGTKDIACPDNGDITKIIPCDGEVLEYRFTVKFKFKEVDENSSVVLQIKDWFNNFEQDTTKIKPAIAPDSDIYNYADRLITSTIDTDFKRAMFRLMEDTQIQDFKTQTNSLYYAGHLRVESLYYMKRKDFARLIATKLDTDYSLDKKHGWAKLRSKILMVVIVIAAIVAGIYSGGTAGEALLQAGLVLMAGMAIGGMTGLILPSEMKTLGKISMIVGIAAMVTGIYAAWQTASKQLMEQAAEDEISKEASQQLSQEALDQAMTNAMDQVGWTDILVQMVENMVSGTMNSGLAMADKAIQGVNYVTDYVKEKEDKKFEDEYGKLSEEYEILNEQNVVDKMNREVALQIEMPMSDMEYDMITKLDNGMEKCTGGYCHKIEDASCVV